MHSTKLFWQSQLMETWKQKHPIGPNNFSPLGSTVWCYGIWYCHIGKQEFCTSSCSIPEVVSPGKDWGIWSVPRGCRGSMPCCLGCISPDTCKYERAGGLGLIPDSHACHGVTRENLWHGHGNLVHMTNDRWCATVKAWVVSSLSCYLVLSLVLPLVFSTLYLPFPHCL
jgi:hypothetical protein